MSSQFCEAPDDDVALWKKTTHDVSTCPYLAEHQDMVMAVAQAKERQDRCTRLEGKIWQLEGQLRHANWECERGRHERAVRDFFDRLVMKFWWPIGHWWADRGRDDD